MPSPEDVLAAILDEHALNKLVQAYCRAVDRGDLETLRDLYHDDAQDEHGAFSSGPVADFIQTLAESRRFIRSMQHHVTTTNFAVSGSYAEGEIYSIATHTIAIGAGDSDVVIGGRYLDKYEKRLGVWKIAERQIVTDWVQVNDPSIAGSFSHPMTRDTPTGSPGPDDPSHKFFTLIGTTRGR
ncbi:nuclear transport factor 2 family protein [Mycobacterium sp. 23]|uniref:nuclear transport factor 2 family protein n=1 Tax=Mycobacterium sp. 23 TaxID=3400424 RepID=UPI003AB05FA7